MRMASDLASPAPASARRPDHAALAAMLAPALAAALPNATTMTRGVLAETARFSRPRRDETVIAQGEASDMNLILEDAALRGGGRR